jgi:hypothetical protein
MSFADVVNNDTFITSVVFNDEALEITFLENRDQTEDIMEAKTLVFAVGGDAEKVDILVLVQDLLRDLVDRVYAERRHGQGDGGRAAIKRRLAERREAETESVPGISITLTPPQEETDVE